MFEDAVESEEDLERAEGDPFVSIHPRMRQRDAGHQVDRLFDEIGAFLKERQPPALMIWGRHDAFFDIAETLSWIKDLPRMEAHILDGGHFLLETHAGPSSALMGEFIERTTRS
jgi:pimeloyl-ACP methyl ester carboxylesterase